MHFASIIWRARQLAVRDLPNGRSRPVLPSNDVDYLIGSMSSTLVEIYNSGPCVPAATSLRYQLA